MRFLPAFLDLRAVSGIAAESGRAQSFSPLTTARRFARAGTAKTSIESLQDIRESAE